MKISKFSFFIYLSILSTTLAGCGAEPGTEPEHGHDHAEEAAQPDADGHDHGDPEEEVHLLQKQLDVMGIELGKFQSLDLTTTVKSNGRLELPPQNKASLSAVMGGRVQAITVLEGDRVRKGQVLARLEHPDFVDLQQQYMSTVGELGYLEAEYLRKKQLLADSISPEKAFQEAESRYLSARAKANGLKAKLRMLGLDPETVVKGEFASTIPVRSPIDGFVRLVEVNMGKFVEPRHEMFEIVDNAHIHIDLLVYEQDMDRVKVGQKVVFAVTNKPDSLFAGVVFATGKAFEEAPRAMTVHAEIENLHGDLLPGMYVDARIITEKQRVKALPDDAIVRDGGLNYIFILRERRSAEHAHAHEGTEAQGHEHETEYVFRKIEVNTGASDIGFTEVVPAMKLIEQVQVVTKGAYYLLAEMKKGEGGHGHHH